GELPPAQALLLRRGVLFGALQARRLALQVPQVEKARALHLAARHDFDLIDPRGVDREDALDSHSVRHLAHGESRVEMRALAADDHALEDLDALLVALADLGVHPYRVADAEDRHLGPGLGLHVPLLHQLDRLRAHDRTAPSDFPA